MWWQLTERRWASPRPPRGRGGLPIAILVLALSWACDRTADDASGETAARAREGTAAEGRAAASSGATAGSGEAPAPSVGEEPAGSGSASGEWEGSGVGTGAAEGLARGVVRETIQGYRHELVQCRGLGDRAPGQILRVDVTLTIDPDGRVSRARSLVAGGPAEECVIGVFREMRFPEFSGPSMRLTYPVRMR